MEKENAIKITNDGYKQALQSAIHLCDLRTLGIERKGFIKHALVWALENQVKQEQIEKALEEEKKNHDYDIKYLNQVIKDLTKKNEESTVFRFV